MFQQGQKIEQWTIIYNNQTSKEQAIIKVRFSPLFFEEIIQFEVEFNSISIDEERRGKDMIVNWRFYDGFDPRGKFWTDSNALAMVERNLYFKDFFRIEQKYNNISSNYYPVDSAIAIRDFNGSNL